MSAILFKQSVKVVVLDNRASAITGGQPTPEVADVIGALCRNYGVTYKMVDAQRCGEAELTRLLQRVVDATGIVVVVIKGACVRHARCRDDRGA